MKTLQSCLFLALMIVLKASFVNAQPGSLDLTFGVAGKVTTEFGNIDQGHAIAFQADGKMVVAGQKGLSVNSDIAVARYNVDGSLDSSFGSGGKVTTDVAGNSDVAFAVAIQPDGKIVVTGMALNIYPDIVVVRYNSDGSLDTGFDGDGIVLTNVYAIDTTDFSDNSHYGWTMAIQPDGKILVGGYSSDENMDHDFTVLRYNINGSLDSSFDADGFVTTAIGIDIDEIRSMFVQPDGKIVAAGYSSFSVGNNEFAVVRYNSNGSLDTTFGVNGILHTGFGSNVARAYAAALQSDGKILVGGHSFNGSDFDLAVLRLNTDGSFDNTFGTNGKVTTAIGSYSDQIWSMDLQADGKIVVAGSSNTGNNAVFADFSLARYNTDGSLDNTFGTNGKVTTAFGSSFDVCFSVKIQVDGKIVLAGWSNSALSSDDFALARYHAAAQTSAVAEYNLASAVSVYPNPTTGEIFLEAPGSIAEITVYNVVGEQVFSTDTNRFQSFNHIDLSELAKGVYFMAITTEDGLYTKKIVVQ